MGHQLALYQGVPAASSATWPAVPSVLNRQSSGSASGSVSGTAMRPAVRLCASCRASEARYGFRDAHRDALPGARPRTLCFDCFRVEIGRRQAVAARMARGWNATQTSLPLAETLERLDRQRRRAQIAARHALGLG